MSDEPSAASPGEQTHEVSTPVESLQDVILRLQKFWTGKGCLELPPCDFAVPFATLHPDAFFGIVGDEPWRAAFLQPVRRPLDGRHGKHPYRLGKHLQFQVLLKPVPMDVQALYLESLKALGMELMLHDVRFSEWNWQARSLGGGGSGWHALLDGLGVTRLTFLERFAGRDLDPAAIEISYGLERLAMTLHGIDDAFQLPWSGQGSDYGRLRLRDEEELSRYAFEIVDPDQLRRRLEGLVSEAERCLDEGLARSAYELSVRCLQPIDLLDARGELSARERTDWLERVCRRVVAAADIAHDPQAAEPSAAKKKQPAKKDPETSRRGKKRQRKRRDAKRSKVSRGRGKPTVEGDEIVSEDGEPGTDSS